MSEKEKDEVERTRADLRRLVAFALIAADVAAILESWTLTLVIALFHILIITAAALLIIEAFGPAGLLLWLWQVVR